MDFGRVSPGTHWLPLVTQHEARKGKHKPAGARKAWRKLRGSSRFLKDSSGFKREKTPEHRPQEPNSSHNWQAEQVEQVKQAEQIKKSKKNKNINNNKQKQGKFSKAS